MRNGNWTESASVHPGREHSVLPILLTRILIAVVRCVHPIPVTVKTPGEFLTYILLKTRKF